MIEVIVTDEMRQRAAMKDMDAGHYENSETNGSQRKLGFVGEEIAHSIVGGDYVNNPNFDFLVNGQKYDAKTKKATVKPRGDYNVSVPALQQGQKCDIYIFVRVLENLTKGWFLGVIPKMRFFDEATLVKKGDRDLSHPTYTYPSDRYVLPVKKLGRFKIKRRVIEVFDKTLPYIHSAIDKLPRNGSAEVILHAADDTRSNKQNRLYWGAWLPAIDVQTGHTKDELHSLFKQTYMTRIYMASAETVDQIDWVNLYSMIKESGNKKMIDAAKKTVSTSFATVDQFREYLNDIEKFCLSRGYMLPANPKDYEGLHIPYAG